MGKSYNPNRNKDGQFATGPKAPANPADRELQATLAQQKQEAEKALITGDISKTDYFRIYTDLYNQGLDPNYGLTLQAEGQKTTAPCYRCGGEQIIVDLGTYEHVANGSMYCPKPLVQQNIHAGSIRAEARQEEAADGRHHYRYRPAFQEEDICPTCTGNDMQNIINWPCKYADPDE